MNDILRVHQFLRASRANGPGTRCVLWLQGCSRRCPGCFNPSTHSHGGGSALAVEDVFAIVRSCGAEIEGITVTGGEPLEQARPLLALLSRVRRSTSLSTILFTGFPWEAVGRLPAAEELLRCVDVLIAGPYDEARRRPRGLRGSDNQTVHFFSDRYGPDDLAAVPEAEIIVTPEGSIVTSGIDPLRAAGVEH
jgi:anaerobic ribonucleoside-triphosphate reductase activating protein